MKILFINISDIQGGSAKAAYRLGKQLEKDYNTKNLFLVRSKYSNDPNVLQTRQNRFEHLVERCVNIFMNLIGLQYQWLPFSPKFILKKAKEFKPDIISLHNTIGGYFRTKDLVELSQVAPIVWTLHDMWAFTRNGAHTYGDESWRELKTFPRERKIFPWIGIDSGNWLIKQKKNIYRDSNVSFVCPSQWLFQLAKESPLFFNKEVKHINHGVDINKFNIIDKGFAKKNIGIMPDSKVVMFVAEKLGTDSTKGGAELVDIINKLIEKYTGKLTLILLGNADGFCLSNNNIDLVRPGYVNSEAEMIKYYNSADVFVYPTKAESFGLVLAEAISCGTPCVSNDVGPVSEIIKNEVSGFTVKAGEIDKFVSYVYNLLIDEEKLQFLAKSSRRHAVEHFSLEKMSKDYFTIYKNVLSIRD